MLLDLSSFTHNVTANTIVPNYTLLYTIIQLKNYLHSAKQHERSSDMGSSSSNPSLEIIRIKRSRIKSFEYFQYLFRILLKKTCTTNFQKKSIKNVYLRCYFLNEIFYLVNSFKK